MEAALVIGTILFLYVVRDAELLRSGDRRGHLPRFLVYGAVQIAAVTASACLAGSVSASFYIEHVRQWRLTLPMLVFHLGIWIYYRQLQRIENWRRLWTVAIIPSPVLVVLLTGVAVALNPERSTALRGITAAGVGLSWVSAVAVWARWNMRAAGDDDTEWGFGFVSLSNLGALLLIPPETLQPIMGGIENLIRTILAYD